ncbi:hypothetical protein KSP40_PGU020407 [Platanthera guangdongensis]|uniref:Isopenicillin N synthase-like Fe(2+) 2OG dioxygenase domain-containing protein n=1 Tax=Platanthera guangdongensis TaxID=2320717 RepID=A0ABR2LYC7_9ASPA
MLGRAAPEFFSLPLESKLRSTSEVPYQGYIGQVPPPHANESMRIDVVDSPISVQNLTGLVWPQGNPLSRSGGDGAEDDSPELGGRSEALRRSHELTDHDFGLSHYGVPVNQETKIALFPHLDLNLLSIVCQHEIGGLEFQTADGSWVNAEPSPTSVHVTTGLAFQKEALPPPGARLVEP